MPAFSNAFHSPYLDNRDLGLGPGSSMGCGELTLHLSCTEEESNPGLHQGQHSVWIEGHSLCFYLKHG